VVRRAHAADERAHFSCFLPGSWLRRLWPFFWHTPHLRGAPPIDPPRIPRRPGFRAVFVVGFFFTAVDFFIFFMGIS